MYKILSPVERKDGGTFWMRVGTGYANKDQSVNVYLDAIPVNNKFQLREMDEADFTPRKRRDDDDGAGPGSPQRALAEIPF